MRKHTMMALTLALAAPLALAAGQFKLSSPDIKAGQTIGDDFIFNGFGCSGKNISPALAWSGAPAGTKSFAVTVYDPDAPTGSGWWHWLVYNLPANTTSLPQGAGDPKSDKAPQGAIQSRTDFAQPGWGGPCPPVGDKPHRYIFTVYALKTDKIDVPVDMPGAMVGYNLNGNALAKASFTALYGRKK